MDLMNPFFPSSFFRHTSTQKRKQQEKIKGLLATLLIFQLCQFAPAHAFSAEQMAALQNLSPAQQQQLANQMGVKLPSGVAKPQAVIEEFQTVSPRSSHTDTAIQKNAKKASDAIELNEKSEEKVITGQLQQFGYDLFAGSPTTFAPATDIPVPTDYIIGPGDTVIVQLYGKDNATHELIVNREGIIQFPDIGPQSVAGLTFNELKEHIRGVVSRQIIGVKASITMGNLRSVRIFVLGEAHRPGSYTVSSLSNITNALFVSGGVTKVGSLRHIQLKRKGKIVGELDLYDLLLNGDTSKDMRLLPGDVIFVPPIGKTVGVSGEVRRPAIYEIKNETQAQQIIQIAGGYLPTAHQSSTRVERITQNGQRTLVDLDLSRKKDQAAAIRDGDIIQIFPILEKIEGAILVTGHLHRPGGFAWKKGQRISDIISSVHQLLPNPDLEYALIKREQQPQRTITIVPFSLANAINLPNSHHDPVLENRDEVLVFGLSEDARAGIIKPLIDQLKQQAEINTPARYVTVGGNVRYPGDYPLTQNMQVQDLINAAGGYTEQAYSVEAEISRATIDKENTQQFQRILIDLGDVENGLRQTLVSRDQLFIKRTPNWNEKESVVIQGEVNFPGTYPIYKGDTIVDLLERAGGLSDYANPEAAIFLREDLRKREQQQLVRLKDQLERDMANIKVESAQRIQNSSNTSSLGDSLLSDLVSAKAQGRLVINLPEILQQADTSIELKDGDKLFIPAQSTEVTVLGEVQFPTSHMFTGKKNVFDYIDISGGYSSRADKKRIYIIKASGEVAAVKNGWIINRNTNIHPGDTIIVPYDTYATGPMTYWMNMSQILYQLATTTAALNSVGVF
jgi:protein involved in polysaccharide export with SLBB domain